MSRTHQSTNSNREVEFLKRAPPKHIKVRQNSSQRKKKERNNKEFPSGKEVFNDSTGLADEKFKLLVDISNLQEEIQPMKDDIEYLKYYIYKTQDAEDLKQAEYLEEKSQEYSDACIEYDNYCDMYSEIVLERLNKEFSQMKSTKRELEMDLEDAQKLLDYTNIQLQNEQLQKNKEKYNENQSKIQELKATLKDLRKYNKEQTSNLCQIYANKPPDQKSAELDRLTNQYNALKVKSLNKKHENELQKRSNEEHYKKRKNEIETKKAEREEIQQRREFNEKWKKKKEEEEANDRNRFLFDSYMKPDDVQNGTNDGTVNQPSSQYNKTNPRKKRIQGYNPKKPVHPRKTASPKNTTQIEETDENMSTDNFESFEGSPAKPNEANEDNSLLTTKTLGMDDFCSTTDAEKTTKSVNENDTIDFTKTLQSELGSDEDGQFKSTAQLDQMLGTLNALTNAPDEGNQAKDNQTDENQANETQTDENQAKENQTDENQAKENP